MLNIYFLNCIANEIQSLTNSLLQCDARMLGHPSEFRHDKKLAREI